MKQLWQLWLHLHALFFDMDVWNKLLKCQNLTLSTFYHSHFSHDLLCLSRQAWALVSVVGGGNESCSEEVREHENHDTGGRALAKRNFTTVDGVGFSVTAYSEWKNGEEQHMMENIQKRSYYTFVLALSLFLLWVCVGGRCLLLLFCIYS